MNIHSGLNKLFKGVNVLISICLAGMIIMTFLNVCLRYIFNTGLVWSEEIARICFIYLVYLGSIGAARDNRHLLIDTLLLKLNKTGQKIMYLVIQAVILWLMTWFAVGSWQFMMLNLRDRWVATHFPVWAVYLPGLLLGICVDVISLVNVYELCFKHVSVSDLIATREDGVVVVTTMEELS